MEKRSSKEFQAKAASVAAGGGEPAPEKSTRVRFGKLPKPLPGGVPYAKSRPELKDFDEARITAAIVNSQAWADVMTPVLAQMDAERTHAGKVAPLYTTHELESVLVYQRVCGLRSYKEARDRLTSDRGAEARRLLNFARPRNQKFRKLMTLRDGVPSEATVSRHRLRFAPDAHYPSLAARQQASFKARAELWARLEQRLLDEHLADEAFRDEARLIHMDGSALITHFTPPNSKDGSEDYSWNDMQNRNVTAPTAGYMSKRSTKTRVGPGWNLLTLTTQTGVPLAWRLTPIHWSEKPHARELIANELKSVVGRLDGYSEDIRVLTADAGFSAPHVRAALHDVGVLENIHHVSHAKSERTQSNAAKKRQRRYAIEREPGVFYDNWYADGHRQLHCRCGTGVVAKRVTRGKSSRGNPAKPDKLARLHSRVEGQCDNCGPISIDAGRWHIKRTTRTDIPKEQRAWFAKNEASVPMNRIDYLFGNPLTYDDPISKQYGTGRWSYNEGFYGQLVSRFNLLKGKRWIRFAEQVELETSMTFAIMHAVTLEQRARVKGQTWARPSTPAAGSGMGAKAPPGLAAVA